MSVTLSPMATGTSIGVTNTLGASLAASGLPITGSGGIVTVTVPVSVSVSPANATLSASQSQQFTATVTGSSNTAVTWSLSPAVGTISSSGLYTAPGVIASAQTVTVTATSVADATKSASATVSLQNKATRAVISI